MAEAMDNAKLVAELRKDAALYEHQTYAAAADEIERLTTALASANEMNERLVAALASANRRLDAIADGAAAANMPGLEWQAREWAAEARALLADIEGKGDDSNG